MNDPHPATKKPAAPGPRPRVRLRERKCPAATRAAAVEGGSWRRPTSAVFAAPRLAMKRWNAAKLGVYDRFLCCAAPLQVLLRAPQRSGCREAAKVRGPSAKDSPVYRRRHGDCRCNMGHYPRPAKLSRGHGFPFDRKTGNKKLSLLHATRRMINPPVGHWRSQAEESAIPSASLSTMPPACDGSSRQKPSF